MVLLRLLEIILGILVVAVILTQVLLPLIMGAKLFPIFRSSRNTIENEIREVQEQLSEKELKEHLEELRAKLKTPIGPSTPEQK
jgi:hypothetical protein